MTVVRAIRELDPALSVTYLSDNAFFPYGGLDPETLVDRVKLVVGQALEFSRFDAVIVACNTASTVVLETLRQHFSLPIIGVVPPIKTASEQSHTREIVLLATEGTVKRTYIDQLIEEFAADCKVKRIGCPDLAFIAEDKVFGRGVDKGRLKTALAPLKAMDLSNADVVILGCTHFPILADELRREIGGDIIWLDPAIPVARQLLRILNISASAAQGDLPIHPQNRFYMTGENSLSIEGLPFFRQMGFTEIARWADRYSLT